MPDDAQKRKKKSLSEISHLFLSSVRDRQTDGANPPRRMPPKRTDEHRPDARGIRPGVWRLRGLLRSRAKNGSRSPR